MSSRPLACVRNPWSFRGGVLVVLGVLLSLASTGRAAAQDGAPAPGWVKVPAGGWVPPSHPLANTGAPKPAEEPPAAVCGIATLRGSYIFSASGHNIVGGVPQPKAIVEAIDFNGDGTLAVPAVTVSINGNVSQGAPGVGVYTLDSSCRGTLKFTGGPSFDLFTDHKGRTAWVIQTNPNTVFQGTVVRLSTPGGGSED